MKNKEEKESIVLEVLKSNPEIKELIIREGYASEIIPEIKDVDVNLNGTISAPYEFYSKRPKQFQEDRAHILFSKNPEKLYITLKTNEHKEKPHYTVTGTLEQSEEMKIFGIAYKSTQMPKTYTITDLSKILRFNKKLFANVDESQKVIEGITKFRAKVESTVTQIDESRGNKSGSYDIQVDSSIPMNFTLLMPLFKGKSAKKFSVDICFEVKGVKEIVLWLESTELATFIQDDANSYIEEELSKMSSLVQIEM